MFHSFHGLRNSINWPASSVWVFIAQLGEHCSANTKAMGLNPVEAPKNFFSGYFHNCLNRDSLQWSHTHFKVFSVCFVFSFQFFFQQLHISILFLIFRHSAQILLENTLLCWQNARLKNRLFCSKFCLQNLSKPSQIAGE